MKIGKININMRLGEKAILLIYLCVRVGRFIVKIKVCSRVKIQLLLFLLLCVLILFPRGEGEIGREPIPH